MRKKKPKSVEKSTTKVGRWLEQRVMGKAYDSISLGKE